MTKIIWFNQPTNHSGSANFLFLTPEKEIDHLTIYMTDPVGPYILGGPVLGRYYGDLTEAAMTLISCLPPGFHFFPDKKADFLEIMNEAWEEANDDSDKALKRALSYEGIHVYSKNHDTTQCCELLRNNSTPDTPIVFVLWGGGGDLSLGKKLAQIYFNMSKEKREELGLKQDWRHYLEA